jgi:hypothetical protein
MGDGVTAPCGTVRAEVSAVGNGARYLRRLRLPATHRRFVHPLKPPAMQLPQRPEAPFGSVGRGLQLP